MPLLCLLPNSYFVFPLCNLLCCSSCARRARCAGYACKSIYCAGYDRLTTIIATAVKAPAFVA